MSKFINTKQKQSIDSLVEGFKEHIKNPYYIHMDKKPTVVTYYSQNLYKSTLDEGSKLHYSSLGDDSAFKYNKIKDFYIYGLEKISTQLEYGDYGLEYEAIEGEGIILPNTIVPVANDFFTINHVESKILFKVISVSINTLETGGNLYKIVFKLNRPDDTEIKNQVDKEYNFISNNVGTKFNTILLSNDYNFVDKVEEILERLKTYYCNIFYSTRVQTFILNYDNTLFYDSYLIEFIKRNDILNGGDEYIYIMHQTTLQRTFALDYDKTFFRFLELPDKKDKPLIYSQAKYINEPYSVFDCRKEDYFKINYIRDILDETKYVINNIDRDLVDRIFNTKVLYKKKNELYKNIIIKYFNNDKLTSDDIESIEFIDYCDSIELFYNIPFIIFILQSKIKSIVNNI